jgi:hypothetical protein
MISTHDVNLTRFGELKGFIQKRPQVREQRDGASSLPVVTVSLRARHGDTVAFPVDMLPFQGLHF